MNPTGPEHVLAEIAQRHVRPDLDLLPGILVAIEQGNHPLKPIRKTRFAATVALLLTLILIVSFFTLPGVARAVRSLFGYIPGLGRVEQNATLRTLAAPVSDSRNGYTLTIESAVLDATHTVITYHARGAFPSWDDPNLRPEMCRDLPILRLPDGTTLAYPTGEGSSSGAESIWKLVYGPLPQNLNRAILVLSCLPELPAGAGPQDWAFALEFVPAPPTLTVYPVIDLPTPTQPAGQAPTESQEAAAPAMRTITWSLNSIAVLPEGYYLETTLAWPPDPSAYGVELYPEALHLTDAAGQEAVVISADNHAPTALAENRSMPLNLQTTALSSPGMAHLSLDYVGVSRSANIRFSFDVGSEARPGQVWEINQDLVLGGHHLRVRSAKYVETPPGAPAMMVIEFESNDGIMAVIASDLEHETLDSGGAPASPQAPLQAFWHYGRGFPQGTITVTISMITERVDGPWTIDWTPSADTITPAPVIPTAMPTLGAQLAQCQAAQLLESAASTLPSDLGGRVAYSWWNGTNNDLFVSNLDGSEATALGRGAFPDLSPDGQQVIYRGMDEGTYVRDLNSGMERLLPGSLHPDIYDNWPRWSPDGRQIAFYRVSGDHISDLYVMNADGSNLRAVTSGPEPEILTGWTPDSAGLYYQAIGAEDQSFRLLNLETGQSREIAWLPKETITASLSPDGSRLLYLTKQALWIDPLDGRPASILLAANGHFANQIHPLWSPDGRWITVNYWETPEANLPGLALLEVDGCRLVHLPRYAGSWLSAWVK